MDFHEVAPIFPLMEGADFAALKDDIAKYGQREPVWVYEGRILDGRNRHRACEELGIETETKEWTGTDPAQFVLSLNLHRRHLSESQRAMVAARMARLRDGQKKSGTSIEVPSQPDAAKMLNVSLSTVQRARIVLNHSTPDQVSAVERGEKTVAGVVNEIMESAMGEKRAPRKKTQAPIENGGRKGFRKDKSAPFSIITKRHKEVAEGQKARMVNIQSSIRGACRGLQELDIPAISAVCGEGELKEWASISKDSATRLREFAEKLTNGGGA